MPLKINLKVHIRNKPTRKRKLFGNISPGNSQEYHEEKKISENADAKKEFLSQDPKYK